MMFRWQARYPIVVFVSVLGLGLTGCSSTTSTDPGVASESGPGASSESTLNEVTRYEVTQKFEPLAMAVVDYTAADYGDAPASEATLDLAQEKFDAVTNERKQWDDFTSTIDYEASDIDGLESAIIGYDQGLAAWYSSQEKGLKNWGDCQEQSTDEFVVATCMLDGYSLEDEQAALATYTDGLLELMTILGIS